MRNKTKLLAPLTAVSVAALAVSGALAAADGATAGGPVQLYEADTELAGSLGTVILTGAITDHGHDHQGVDPTGTINKLVLSKGSFEINVGDLGNLLTFTPDPNKGCSADGSATAPIPIVAGSGTGAYKGISGTLKTTASVAFIVPRLANDGCDTNATRYPGVLIANGAGTISYK